MIGMPVSAVGSKRHDDIGLDPPHLSHKGGNSLAWIRTVEMLIEIIED
jgi:hypothetical protein